MIVPSVVITEGIGHYNDEGLADVVFPATFVIFMLFP